MDEGLYTGVLPPGPTHERPTNTSFHTQLKHVLADFLSRRNCSCAALHCSTQCTLLCNQTGCFFISVVTDPWVWRSGRSCLTVLVTPIQSLHIGITLLFIFPWKKEWTAQVPSRSKFGPGQSSSKAASYLERAWARTVQLGLIPALRFPSWWPWKHYLSSLGLSF